MPPLPPPPPALVVQQELPPWRFALRYEQGRLLADPGLTAEFLRAYVRGERRFFRTVRNPATGLTWDGWNLDPDSGEPRAPRPFSAASKECLDLALLVKVLENHPLALELATPPEAEDILRRKLTSYQAWYRENPGYGGFLPWYMNEQPLRPTPDWLDSVPGLDNGEWLWSLLVVEQALRETGRHELADGYADFNRLLLGNLRRLFFDPERRLVFADRHVLDPSRADSPTERAAGKLDYLTGEHGVHEGAMMVMLVSLFGGLSHEEVEAVWKGTRMVRLEHPAATTWQGYWGSAHESWAYLFMPCRDLPEYRELFRLRELIRTRNAADRGYPGLGASINAPGRDEYVSGGIEGVGSQPVRHNDVYALYGVFPTLLYFSDRPDQPNLAAAWLLNMLKGPRMQGPLGGGESGPNDGLSFCPLKTVDGTFPNLLALMGGLERESARMLRERGVYARFCEILLGEYREAFGDEPLHQRLDFAAPSLEAPCRIPDYPGSL